VSESLTVVTVMVRGVFQTILHYTQEVSLCSRVHLVVKCTQSLLNVAVRYVTRFLRVRKSSNSSGEEQ